MRSLSAAVKKSVDEAKIDTGNKLLSIEKKINKFDRADEVLTTAPIELEQPVEKKVVTKVKKDSFCFPENDYELIQSIRDRFLKNSKYVTKSEVLRIGLNVLNDMVDQDLIKVSNKIEKIKIGRK